MKRNRNFIYQCGKFANAREKHRVLQVYDEVIATLAKNLTAAGKPDLNLVEKYGP